MTDTMNCNNLISIAESQRRENKRLPPITYFDVPIAGWPGNQCEFIAELRRTRKEKDFQLLLDFVPELREIFDKAIGQRKAAK